MMNKISNIDRKIGVCLFIQATIPLIAIVFIVIVLIFTK